MRAENGGEVLMMLRTNMVLSFIVFARSGS